MLRVGQVGGVAGTGSLSNGHAPGGRGLYALRRKKGRFQNGVVDAMANISWAALETSSATQMRSFPYEDYARRNIYCFTPADSSTANSGLAQEK